ncbi:GTP-binding protein [Rubritalea spongiae]|uniref:GTP-binding protein n=1 Tax=Rubritalea spongiae TaxID=430797 RepID=A0ABW5DZP7_9BACT
MIKSPQTSFSPLPKLVAARPMLMFTGFLGAGKTTLLRELLKQLKTRNHLADVILNDRENADIDKETLVDHAADIEALTGSCVCCDGYHTLVRLILEASESKHDVLLIELNGTADPVPLQESFTLLESKFCLRPRWQVCVIDVRHFGKRNYFNDLEELQLETASHYYISWDSELTTEELEQLESEIKEINPRATRATAAALADALSQAIQSNSRHAIATQQPRGSNHQSVNLSPAVAPNVKHDERHKLAHAFTGCQIIIPEAVETFAAEGWLRAIPSSVIRAKALLILENDPSKRYLYERVGNFISPDPISGPNNSEAPCSAIFIGADIDPLEILRLSKEILHPDCHFPE